MNVTIKMMMIVLGLVGELLILLLQILLISLETLAKWMIPASVRAKSLEGETMLITGAGGGIGRVFARKFAAQGVRVVLWDINAVAVEETARLVRVSGGKAWWYVCDVTKRPKVTETAQRVLEEAGEVTMVLNNAGIVTGKSFQDLTCEDFERTLSVNSLAHVWTLKTFMPRMLERNHGHVITIASIMGEVTVPGLSDYCMSKHATIGLHETLLREVRAQGKDGVHFTLVNPYKIDTGMFDGVDIKESAQLLIPTMQPDFIGDKVVEAVQINQDVVRTPFIFNAIIPLYKILPQKALLLVEDFLENDKAMSGFCGHRVRKNQLIEEAGSPIE